MLQFIHHRLRDWLFTQADIQRQLFHGLRRRAVHGLGSLRVTGAL